MNDLLLMFQHHYRIHAGQIVKRSNATKRETDENNIKEVHSRFVKGTEGWVWVVKYFSCSFQLFCQPINPEISCLKFSISDWRANSSNCRIWMAILEIFKNEDAFGKSISLWFTSLRVKILSLVDVLLRDRLSRLISRLLNRLFAIIATFGDLS